MGNEYNGELCKVMHEQIEKRFNRLDDGLSGHGAILEELKDNMLKLTTILEYKESQAAKKPSFWTSPTGQRVVIGLIVIGVVIVCAAVGFNAMEALQVIKP